MKPRTLLVLIAHPDDESFGMGATLARYAAEGTRVILVCATKGEAGIPGLPPQTAAQVREQELRAAAATLGLSEVRFLDYHDGDLAAVDGSEAAARLVHIMQTLRPQVVITFGPDGISGHPDHIAIHRWTTLAFDRAGLSARLFYLAPSEATLQGCGVPPTREAAGWPVAGIDVAGYLVTKVRAMQCHASQHPPYPGRPEDEAARLACHEYFTLARPRTMTDNLNDLFAGIGDDTPACQGTTSSSP